MPKATRPQTEHQAVIADLDRQAQLESDLQSVKSQISQQASEHEQVSKRIKDTNNAIGGYEKDEKRWGRPLSEARAELNTLQARRAELDAAIAALRDRKRQLVEELVTIRPTCQASAVLAHNEEIAATEARLKELGDLIVEHEAKLAQAHDVADPLAPLMRRREDLLAEIVQGEAEKAGLKQIDAEIAAASKEHEQEIARRELIIDEAGQALAGLKRRREGVAEDLERLRALAPKVLDQFLLGEIGQIAQGYAHDAAKLAQTIKRIVVLERLRSSNGPRTTGTTLPMGIRKTYIPTLADSRQIWRHGPDHMEPTLVGIDLDPGATALEDTLAAERDRLGKLGITHL